MLDYPVNPVRLYDENRNQPHRILYDMINRQRQDYEKILNRSLDYREQIMMIRQQKDITNDTDPGWNNDHLPGLDIIMLYTMLAEIRPKRYVEIGSGTSTRIANKVKTDLGLPFTISSIDPQPRKAINKVASTVEAKEVQQASMEYFTGLEAGDVLFFDGTHTLYPNTDVMWFFLEILPQLKKGVYVQLHDVYLPYDYPDFMCERYYNEQYVLAACLLSNPGKYEMICPNYFIYTDKALHNILSPYWDDPLFQNIEKHGGSFWIRMM